MANALPNAPALWWNASRIRVSCPYCGLIHGHGFPRSRSGRVEYGGIQRLGDCGIDISGSYNVVFPFNTGTDKAGYEINKREGLFVSARFLAAQIGDPERGIETSCYDELSKAAEASTRPQFSDGSTKTVTKIVNGKTITESVCAVEDAVMKCMQGEVEQVEKYIQQFRGTEDYKIFLQGEDGTGKTALWYAAGLQSPKMIQLLLRYGCDVNAQTYEGRTPLMEAALWGRRENVRVLLAHGADKTMRDQDGKLAIDLAKPSERNDNERHNRVGEFKESPYVERRNRRQIVRVLEGHHTRDELFGLDVLDSERPHYTVQSDDSLALVTPIVQLEKTEKLSSGWKYVAVLDRGGQFPPVYASSRSGKDGEEVLVGKKSQVELVNKIILLVGCAQQSGPSNCGSSHAVKQLIAYFVDKHIFLPDDVVSDAELNELQRGYQYGLDEFEDEKDAEEKRRKIALTLLKHAQPSVRVKKATIVSSTAECPECQEFCQRVNSHFGLQIKLKQRHKRAQPNKTQPQQKKASVSANKFWQALSGDAA